MPDHTILSMGGEVSKLTGFDLFSGEGSAMNKEDVEILQEYHCDGSASFFMHSEYSDRRHEEEWKDDADEAPLGRDSLPCGFREKSTCIRINKLCKLGFTRKGDCTGTHCRDSVVDVLGCEFRPAAG